LALVLLVRMLPEPTGIVLSLMSAVAAMAGVHRLRRAVWVNHRYRLTTWRWCCVVSSLLLMGWMGRLMLLP
jgi:hypothetical protein